MKDKIVNIIIKSLKELNSTFEDPVFEKPTLDTQIFGLNCRLDSLGLVALISSIEGKISDEFNKEIIIASEKTMSQKSSPFKSVQSLADYLEGILGEE